MEQILPSKIYDFKKLILPLVTMAVVNFIIVFNSPALNQAEVDALKKKWEDNSFKSEINQQFQRQLNNIGFNHDIEITEEQLSISVLEKFRLEIPLSINRFDFDFESDFCNQNIITMNRQNRKRIKNSSDNNYKINELGKFLAIYLAKSLGRNPSLLFSIKTIVACTNPQSLDSRSAVFRGSTLYLNLNKFKDSFDLFKIWNSGEPMLSREHWNLFLRTAFTTIAKIPNMIGRLPEDYQGYRDLVSVGYFNNPLAVFKDRIFKYWSFLNPIGDFRSDIRFRLQSQLFKRRQNHAQKAEDFSLQRKQQIILQLAKNKGVSEEVRQYLQEANDEEIEKIFSSWRSQLQIGSTPSQIFESNVFGKSNQTTNGSIITIMARQNDCWVSYNNNHDISVDASLFSLLGSNRPIHEFDPTGPFYNKGTQKVEVVKQRTRESNLFSSKETTETRVSAELESGYKFSLNIDEVEAGVFCGNTSDEVDVNAKAQFLKITNINPIALKAYVLDSVVTQRIYGDDLN